MHILPGFRQLIFATVQMRLALPRKRQACFTTCLCPWFAMVRIGMKFRCLCLLDKEAQQ